MNQMQKIMAETNYDFSRTKLVKCLAVHNEQDWVELNLRNNYDEYDIIRVVEGAVENRPGSTDDGHSTDSTIELVRNFPDPDNKIELYQLQRHFRTLEEQKQIFLELASPGEWLLIVDCDEFYMEGDINKVREAIRKRPLASELIPTFLHFYRDLHHIKNFDPEWNIFHQRIIRYQPGMRYHTHPVATDANGVCTCLSAEYQPHRYTVPGLYIYHYGHAKGKEFHAMKQSFYKKELAKFSSDTGGTAADAFDRKFVEFCQYTELPESILSFDGEHPEVIKSHSIYSEYDNKYHRYETQTPGIFKKWNTVGAYSEKELPNIPVWMYGNNKKAQPFYNVLRV